MAPAVVMAVMFVQLAASDMSLLLAARTFNQGFATVEYVSAALVDLDLHSLDKIDDFNAADFEKAALARIQKQFRAALQPLKPDAPLPF